MRPGGTTGCVGHHPEAHRRTGGCGSHREPSRGLTHMASEVRWRKLVYLGRRGRSTAWRAHALQGGQVLFILPLNELRPVVLGLRVAEPLVGADPGRHAAMV